MSPLDRWARPASADAVARPKSRRRTLLVALIAPLLSLPLLAAVPTASDAATLSLFGSSRPAKAKAYTRATEVGLRFQSSTDGIVSGMRFYKAKAGKSGTHRAALWSGNGQGLEFTNFKAKKAKGWQTVKFDTPIRVKANTIYVVSYYSPKRLYASTTKGLKIPRTKGTLTALGSVYRSGKGFPVKSSTSNYWIDVEFEQATVVKAATAPTTPRPTATPTATVPASGWPSAGNTGVPSGTSLSAYTGPCTITADNTVIDAKTVNCTLNIQASNVRIVNSRINGGIDLRDPKNTDYSFTITDSEVHVGDNLNTGIMRGNFRATRVEVTGGRRSIYCVYNCVVEDSWVHLQGGDPGGDAHFSGVRMEQNGTFRHNTLVCEAARGSGTGCSAALTGYGDFAPVQNNLIENNRFVGSLGGGSTMCAYGGSSGADGSKPYGHLARDIRFINNVFTRGSSGECGNLGAVAGYDASRPGNLWQGNTWDDGTAIRYTD